MMKLLLLLGLVWVASGADPLDKFRAELAKAAAQVAAVDSGSGAKLLDSLPALATTAKPAPTQQPFTAPQTVEVTTLPTTPQPSSWSIVGAVSSALGKAGSAATGLFNKAGSAATGMVNKAGSTAADLIGKVTTSSANAAVDLLFQNIKLVSGLTMGGQLPLPDLEASLYPGASFHATGGFFRDMRSLRRSNNVVIERQGLGLVIQVPLKLYDLQVGYEKYKISVFLGMGTSGRVMVKVAENEIVARIRLSVGPSCAVNLEKVEVRSLEGINVDLTSDCTLCGMLTSKASTFIANTMSGMIKTNIQSSIDSTLRQLLKDNPVLCSKLVGI